MGSTLFAAALASALFCVAWAQSTVTTWPGSACADGRPDGLRLV